MAIFFFACTAFALLGAFQERKNYVRSIGFILCAILTGILGAATVSGVFD